MRSVQALFPRLPMCHADRMKSALICALPLFAGALLAQEGVVVEGTVVDKNTGVGISGVTVQLAALNRNRYEATTGAAGIFRIAGVKPGDYRWSAEKDGFFQDEPLSFGTVRTVHVGEAGVPLQFALVPGGTLRGRVIGVDGKPAAKIEVFLYPNLQGETASTDEEGAFAFHDLRPGQYTLVARAKTGPSILVNSSVNNSVRMEPVPTYFPSVVDPAAAQSIAVRAGVEQGGYDIRLQAAPVYRLRGVVLQEDGKPAAKAVVKLVSREAQAKFPGGAEGGFVSSAANGAQAFSLGGRVSAGKPVEEEPVVTGTDGVFEFRSVQAGEYTVGAESDLVHDEVTGRDRVHFGSTQISVGRSDLDELRIQVAKPFDLRATVEVSAFSKDGSPAPANAFVTVRLVAEDGFHSSAGRRGKDGAFTIESVTPGRHRILSEALMSGAGYYVADVLLGDSSVLGRVAELSQVSPPIRIILKRGGTVRGVVDNGANANVVLLPQSLMGTGQSVKTDGQGNFVVAGLPPGVYYAMALDRFDFREMQDPQVLAGLIPGAASVSVEGGATASVELRLIQSPR
jgi:hypothetical protein